MNEELKSKRNLIVSFFNHLSKHHLYTTNDNKRRKNINNNNSSNNKQNKSNSPYACDNNIIDHNFSDNNNCKNNTNQFHHNISCNKPLILGSINNCNINSDANKMSNSKFYKSNHISTNTLTNENYFIKVS